MFAYLYSVEFFLIRMFPPYLKEVDVKVIFRTNKIVIL